MKIQKRIQELHNSLNVIESGLKGVKEALDEHDNAVSIFTFSTLKLCADIENKPFPFHISIEDKGIQDITVYVEFDEIENPVGKELCKESCTLKISQSGFRLFLAESYSIKEVEEIIYDSIQSDNLYSAIRDFIIKEY